MDTKKIAKPAIEVKTSDKAEAVKAGQVRIGDGVAPWSPKVRIGDGVAPWGRKARIGDGVAPW